LRILETRTASECLSTKNFIKTRWLKWTSGVTIVTTRWNNENYGLTASSFTSVSLEPPLVSVSLTTALHTNTIIKELGRFAVSILADDQIDLGMRFAGMLPDIEDRFEGLSCELTAGGSPIIPGCLAWLDCRVSQSVEAGDHTIFVAEVVAAWVREDGKPLLYYNRDWRHLI
jgi:flavin reductase (DIM6/NTAB) family NADH-FMN oxidoreductase RutF